MGNKTTMPTRTTSTQQGIGSPRRATEQEQEKTTAKHPKLHVESQKSQNDQSIPEEKDRSWTNTPPRPHTILQGYRQNSTKQLIQLNGQKTTQSENGQKTTSGSNSPAKTYQPPMRGTRKNTLHVANYPRNTSQNYNEVASHPINASPPPFTPCPRSTAPPTQSYLSSHPSPAPALRPTRSYATAPANQAHPTCLTPGSPTVWRYSPNPSPRNDPPPFSWVTSAPSNPSLSACPPSPPDRPTPGMHPYPR
uniref:Proline-rich receptor-like protein kinase PERK10 n=1 Tax=Camelus bactrianus TaxID=9837 RepID=A0A9W3EDG3_CAMBA|nr:proline-rich receptor-like protein kinase PERK10 [Camelus bactrianus]